MNDPIISPWLIYLISRLDVAQAFFGALVAVSITALIVTCSGMFMNADRELRSEKLWFSINLKATKIAAIILGVSATLSFFLPSSRTAIAMYIASQITPQTVQQASDTVDKISDKVIEKIIKVKEAQ